MNEPSTPTPVFLLSLPRSGSTLLQRMLGAHDAVSTSPEPTFLLPLLHISRMTDVVATFDQRYTSWAIEDFIATIPGGRAEYDRRVAGFAQDLYSLASQPGARYHIDKTPKYHLVADDIATMFPGSPIIVLWRNPLSIIASIMSTWGGSGGRWNLSDFRIDLDVGIRNLTELADHRPDRILAVRYEDVVSQPEQEMRRICGYLDIDFDSQMIEGFAEISLEGRVQDPNSKLADFQRLRTDRTERWRSVLSNPVRQRWCRRYLLGLGHERLARMGYSLDELLTELDELPVTARFLATDLRDIPLDVISRALELQLFVRKWRRMRAGQGLFAHK